MSPHRQTRDSHRRPRASATAEVEVRLLIVLAIRTLTQLLHQLADRLHLGPHLIDQRADVGIAVGLRRGGLRASPTRLG